MYSKSLKQLATKLQSPDFIVDTVDEDSPPHNQFLIGSSNSTRKA